MCTKNSCWELDLLTEGYHTSSSNRYPPVSLQAAVQIWVSLSMNEHRHSMLPVSRYHQPDSSLPTWLIYFMSVTSTFFLCAYWPGMFCLVMFLLGFFWCVCMCMYVHICIYVCMCMFMCGCIYVCFMQFVFALFFMKMYTSFLNNKEAGSRHFFPVYSL